jgi:glycosyltransferase involved in cell wall biosynthesis
MLKQAVVGFYTVRALRQESLVVHVDFQGIPFIRAPLVLGFRLSGLRVILEVHDVLPHRWLLPRPLRFLEWATFWIMYLAADKLIVHHQDALRLLRKEFGIRPSKLIVIPYGPYHLSDAPPPYEKGAEIVALLFGTLRENKGIHLAIRAVQELRADGHPIKLVIAGKPFAYERNYWRRCKALIEASPAGISVIDRYIEDEEVKDVVASANLFLLPYMDFYSQSAVAILALSNGRPIVATQAGGISEVLLPGRTGIRIEQPTEECIAEALLRAVRLGHHGLKRMGEEAFVLFEESYSWDANAKEYIALYQEMETKPDINTP